MDPTTRDQVFIAYSHRDIAWVQRLKRCLYPLDLMLLDDRLVQVKGPLRLKNALARARVAVLMVSPDFLESPFITQPELSRLFEAEEGLVVVWILVRPCNYAATDVGHYYGLLDFQRALADMDEAEAERMLSRAATGLTNIVQPPRPTLGHLELSAVASHLLRNAVKESLAAHETGPGAAGEGISPPRRPVRLGVSAPSVVEPGQEFTARFTAYHPELASAVRRQLGKVGPKARPHLDLAEVLWKVGTTITVRLSGDGLEVSPASQDFVWEGPRHYLDFDVRVRTDSPECITRLKFDVCFGDVVLARLRLEISIRKSTSGPRHYAFATAPRTAFASYASEDKPRVLDRVAAIRIAVGLDIFMDCLSLHPNDHWRACLEQEISSRDVFMLFWSEWAAKSCWVEWEWRQALRQKGLEAIQAHPLDSSPKTPLPQELSSLHVGDLLMAVREAALQGLPHCAYFGHADHPFRRKVIDGSGACRSPGDGAAMPAEQAVRPGS